MVQYCCVWNIPIPTQTWGTKGQRLQGHGHLYMRYQYINNQYTDKQYQHNLMVTPVLHVVSITTMSEGMLNSEVNQNDVANIAESGFHKVRLKPLSQ